MIECPSRILIQLCMLIQSHVKYLNMQTKFHVKKTQNFIVLDPDTVQYYVLTPQLFKKDTLLIFEPTEIQSTISPNTSTAQDEVFFFKKLKHFCNRVLFTKHSDNTL